jgi:hypothetical protein
MNANLFHKMLGVTPAGNGYFVDESSRGSLGDDASIMMISGLGSTKAEEDASKKSDADKPTVSASTPVKLLGLELPLWTWLVIAALLGGAGGYFIGRKA